MQCDVKDTYIVSTYVIWSIKTLHYTVQNYPMLMDVFIECFIYGTLQKSFHQVHKPSKAIHEPSWAGHEGSWTIPKPFMNIIMCDNKWI